MQILSFFNTICWKTFFSPWMLWTPLLKIIWSCRWKCISGLSILFLGLYVCLYSSTTWFDCCSFVISFEIQSVRIQRPPNLFFFVKIISAFWEPLKFHMNLWMDFLFLLQKNVIRIFTVILPHLYISLGNTDILTILNLPI